ANRRAGVERFVLWGLVVTLAVTPVVYGEDLRWLVAAWFPAAAGGMVFVGWARVVAGAAPVVAALIRVGVVTAPLHPAYQIYYLAYSLTIYCLGGGCLLAATRVVQVTTELSASRAELADLASRAERQRASRDLHDTLGQR